MNQSNHDTRVSRSVIEGKTDPEDIVEALASLEWDDNTYDPLIKLTHGQRVLVSLWWVNAEVVNGGFSQYFGNNGGCTVGIALEAAREIGAYAYAALLQEAIRPYPGGIPATHLEFEAVWDQLDEAWFALNDGRQDVADWTDDYSLMPLLARYVAANESEFFVD